MRGLGPEPDSLDPQKALTTQAQTVLRDICEPLTTVAHEGSVAPGIAASWGVDPAGGTWTFTLRDAHWSNGDPVVAEDFAAAFRRLVDPRTASPYAQYLQVIRNAPSISLGQKPAATLGVEAPDPHTLTIALSSPAAQLPQLLSHPSTCPIQRATLALHPNDYGKPGVLPSDGAYVLQDWLPGAYIRLRRNRNYWNDGATANAGVDYLPTSDENAELARFRSGGLDITSTVPRGQLDWIRGHLASQLHVAPVLAVYYYAFNLHREPFSSKPTLRRALSLVIDREALARDVLRVGEKPAYGWVPPGVANYTSNSFDYSALPLSTRIVEARRLYREAGYSVDHPLRFELRYNAGEVHTKIAVAVASMWKEALGAEVTLAQVEFKSLLQQVEAGDVQVYRSSWLADYNDAEAFASVLEGDAATNTGHYHSAAYDQLLTQARASVDPDHRRTLLEQAERTLLADHPVIPLYFQVSKHLVSPRVQGWYGNVLDVTYSKDLQLIQ